MTANDRPVGGAAPSLERDAIGLPEVLFQSITHMAPAVATALSIGAATTFAGGITPLAVLFAMIAVLFTAFAMAELAKHLPSAGGMFTYTRNGLGSFFGWLVAWGYALAEPLVMPLLLGGFGFYGAIFLSSYLNINFEYAWIGLAVLCGLVVWFLTYRGIGISTRTGIVLGVIEIVIFLLVSALLIVNADQNTLNVFLPGADGVRPAFQGMIFCLLAFIGFEAAAPLGEETREPRRTIPRAVIWSAVLIGAVLRVQLLRRDGLLRTGPDDRVLHVQRRRPVGLHGRGGPARHRRPADHLRDPQQLARERELRGDRGDPDAVRHGPRPAAAALVRGGQPRAARAGERGPLPGHHARSSSRSSSGSSSPTTRIRRPRAPGASAA